MRDWFGQLNRLHHDYQIVVSQARTLGDGQVLVSGSLSQGDHTGVAPCCALHRIDGELIVDAHHYLSEPETIERLGLIPRT